MSRYYWLVNLNRSKVKRFIENTNTKDQFFKYMFIDSGKVTSTLGKELPVITSREELKKDVKKKRADYFKNKDTSKNDNRPAPGDKGAKTKPSIHTTKFKKMYGEVYEIGTPEYTKHTIDMTPGQKNPIKKVKGFLDREREKPTEKDVKEWAATESTMNKYRERYKEEWKAKLSEVVAKMIEKL